MKALQAFKNKITTLVILQLYKVI